MIKHFTGNRAKSRAIVLSMGIFTDDGEELTDTTTLQTAMDALLKFKVDLI